MVKAADALAAEGHDVRVVSTRNVEWAIEYDEELAMTRSWRWRPVDYMRQTAPLSYLRSGTSHRLSRAITRKLGPDAVPFSLSVRAYARVHADLVRAAIEEPADAFYGGSTGALAATAEAALRTGTRYGLDLEDLHSAEMEGGNTTLSNALASRIERQVLPRAAFLTTSSAPIARAYRDLYGVTPATVHNTQLLASKAPDTVPHEGPIRAYWFSQTIGAGRGLEDFFHGAALAGIPLELHLRGRADGPYVDRLIEWAQVAAPRVAVNVHSPGSPDHMVDSCREYDIGLALEQQRPPNRDLCISNKAFTYMAAGLAVVFTDTEGQRLLANDLGPGALLFRSSDHRTLADGLLRWHHDRRQLLISRHAAWEAAKRRWNWNHPCERKVLVATVAQAL
jgi:hypothetical protein